MDSVYLQAPTEIVSSTRVTFPCRSLPPTYFEPRHQVFAWLHAIDREVGGDHETHGVEAAVLLPISSMNARVSLITSSVTRMWPFFL